MRDGKIVSDEAAEGDMIAAGAAIPNEQLVDGILAKHRAALGKIKFLDYVRQAMSAMVSHKMRSLLSILGIMIGVAAVIAMLALGNGAKASIEQQLASLGSNLLMIRPARVRSGGVTMESGVTRFTYKDVKIIAGLPSVKRAYGSVTSRGQVVYGSKNWNTLIEGTGLEYPAMRAATPVVGRFFTAQEMRNRDRVAVIGTTVASNLFGNANPAGETIKLNLVNFRVIGVLPTKGAGGFHDQDDTVIIPLTTAMYRVLGKQYIDSIYAEATGPSDVEKAQQEIMQAMARQHRVKKNPEEAFDIRNMADIKSTMEATMQTLSLLLGSIAAISLLVGGIGIMNIMLVSVTERTREIGLRKAIGANNKDIMVQFLIESVLMSLIGGITGVILGIGASEAMYLIAGWAVKNISVFNISGHGIFLYRGRAFGIWPAHKASQLNPIEALRYE